MSFWLIKSPQTCLLKQVWVEEIFWNIRQSLISHLPPSSSKCFECFIGWFCFCISNFKACLAQLPKEKEKFQWQGSMVYPEFKLCPGWCTGFLRRGFFFSHNNILLFCSSKQHFQLRKYPSLDIYQTNITGNTKVSNFNLWNCSPPSLDSFSSL